MTYILGASCIDGVVLVSDQKFLRGSTPSYHEKLVEVFPSVIMGGAGTRGIIDRFYDEIKLKIENEDITNIEELINYSEDRTLDIHRRYYGRADGMELLIGLRGTGGKSKLFNIVTSGGVAEPIKEYIAIGSGVPYGSFLLKELWNKKMTMMEFAKVGYFLVDYITKFKLEDSVGGNPKVWFIPEIIEEEGKDVNDLIQQYPARTANKSELETMKNYSDIQINKINQALENLKTLPKIISSSQQDDPS
ncbi:hypothetical protein [Nitrosopumilus sp. b3]|uniref:hypothetical protein n=1 Tax=Nitrosopumilus sp. b3 TaxID=2109909 RepID=UPI0015F500C6|nr:hypothetical protein [Nitrosopumilus sp. b3]